MDKWPKKSKTFGAPIIHIFHDFASFFTAVGLNLGEMELGFPAQRDTKRMFQLEVEPAIRVFPNVRTLFAPCPFFQSQFTPQVNSAKNVLVEGTDQVFYWESLQNVPLPQKGLKNLYAISNLSMGRGPT